MPSKSRSIKDHMVESGMLQEKEDHFLLLKDKLISSSSYAASLVAGSSRSGPQSWKTEKGETLKVIEAKLINSET